MCLEHIRLSLPGTNSLGQAYVCSFLQPICCTLCNYTGFFMASGNLQENEFYSFKQLHIVLMYLKIIISTSPWQPGSKNRKDCPILHIYQRIKGCYCKLFLEHSGLNLNCVTAINSPIVCVYPRDGLAYFLKAVKRYLGGTWQLMA